MNYGVNDVSRRPCAKSVHHGFHPANEACGYCEPEVPKLVEPKCLGELYYEWCCLDCVVDDWSELSESNRACWEKSAEAEIKFWMDTRQQYPRWHPEAKS